MNSALPRHKNRPDQPQPIKPRRMAFDMSELNEKFFFRGNPILSTFLYALSASFPDGERFFIDAVRHYQKDLKDPVLISQVRGFIGQEAHHAHIHDHFNERAETLGMAMTEVQGIFKKRIMMVQKRLSPADQLAITSAIEHITATVAQWTLENSESELTRGDNSPLREMLLWHAMEEIEHKAVAFDVFRQTVNNETLRIRWAKVVFRIFWVQMARAQCVLLWRDRSLPSLQHVREAWQFMWGENGMRRWARPELDKYLYKGFHPSDIDQSHLLEGWHESHPEVAALQIA